ncbi:hypothetical protein [Bacillus toyonensis]|uniref:hypothetical protein n=1 Tax=Bacillus toyonensis TaxID=155322 RepID=UPI002175D452|nr:hypothetical protein [Bacillus toyonensis]
MTTLEMLAVSPITLTIRQSEEQKELVGIPTSSFSDNEEINWEKVNKQLFEEFGASMNIGCTILFRLILYSLQYQNKAL